MAYLVQADSKIFYTRQGAGEPALIFVHGFACTHWVWDLQAETLSVSRSVVTCDLRGHGLSVAPAGECTIELLGWDVAALAQTLRPQSKVVLIGHSLGCRVVLEAYAKISDLVAGIVLLDGSWTRPTDYPYTLQAVEDRMCEMGYAAFVEGEIKQMFPGNDDSVLRERIVRDAARVTESVGRSLYLRCLEWDAGRMESALQQLGVPLLILQSTAVLADRTRVTLTPGMSTPWLELVRCAVPLARIHIIPGVGHFSMLEAPESINGAIADFVQTSERPTPAGRDRDRIESR